MADVGVAPLAKQADRLRAERSGRAAAVHNDPRQPIGQHDIGGPLDVSQWQIDGIRKMRGGKRLGRQHVDDRDAAGVHRSNQISTRDFRDGFR